MCKYDIFIKTGKKYAEIQNLHYKEQKGLEKISDFLLKFVIFGSVISFWIVQLTKGEFAADNYLLGGVIWYAVGYLYCNSLWKQEKELNDYWKFVTAYKNEHPEEFDINGNYIYESHDR
ncbi:MAG TPA: hypothetical protein PLR90_06140 [Methylophilus sp.]|nr:hypothetical protein [Methylophilus sp.]HQQ33479.1 hypothetical protein [Methylophilus sp.]